MWVGMSDQELIDTSDLIVMGEWQDAGSQRPTGSDGLLLARIVITEVLKGPAELRQAWVLVSGNPQLRASSDLGYRTGDRGLWLLRKSSDHKAFYLADHPQRFVPAQGGEARIQQLRRRLPHN